MPRFLVSTAVLLAALGQPAMAEDPLEFQVEPWQGSAIYSETDGSFSHCLMAAQFDRQMSLVVALDRAGGASLGVRNPRWSLALLEQQPMVLTLGAARQLEATATAVDATLLLVRFEDGEALMDDLAHAPTVSVAQESQSYRFVMVNGQAATDALLACAMAAGTEVDAADAAAESAPASDTGESAADRERTILVDPITLDQTVARNFLQAAGLTDFTLMTPSELDDFLGDARAAWTDGLIYGALYTVAPRQRRLDRAADELLDVLAEGCDGDFTSSPLVEPDADGMIERRSAACDEASLGMLFRTTAINGETGTLIILHAGLRDEADRLAAADDMLIAAIRRGQIAIE